MSKDPTVKASAASTAGSLTVIDSETDGGAPPHVHTREDEAIFVIDGALVVHVADDTFHARRGDFVFMPRNVVHDWDVESGSARVLIIAAPGGLEAFLDEFHAASNSAERERAAARYGLTFPR